MAGRTPDDPSTGTGGSLRADRGKEFLAHRRMVFTIAYNVTGSVADAEDVVQETYLRYAAVAQAPAHPRAYLARAASRQALNAVRAASRRREDYQGEWLPEPLPTGPDAGGRLNPEAAALTEAEVSTAMLVLLQQLSGPERVALVLRDVFGFAYSEVAAVLESSEPAVRQLVHRARGRVRTPQPRSLPDKDEHRAAVERFLEAALTGRPRHCWTCWLLTWCCIPTAAGRSVLPAGRCTGRNGWQPCCLGWAPSSGRQQRRSSSS